MNWEVRQGDALELIRAVPDCSVDMVFTDPPYGHNNNNGDLINRREAALGRLPSDSDKSQGADARPIANDGPEANELFKAILPEFKRVLKPDCCCCCCGGGGGPDPQFARWSLWLDEVLTFKQMVVWDKGPMGMGWHYRRSYETVLVAHKGQKCRWYDDTDKVENIVRDVRKIIPQADEHPTPKPVSLIKRFIHYHTQPGDLILDPFCGGGSTLEAAVSMNRNAIGFEIDQHWADYSRKRMQTVAPSLFSECVKGGAG